MPDLASLDSLSHLNFDRLDRHLNFREQSQVCRAHKMHSARQEWISRGYPSTIDWDRLPKRIISFYPQLDAFLNGTTPSFYRRLLELDTLKTGRNRTAKQLMNHHVGGGGGDEGDVTSAGYYGPRGSLIL